MATPGEQVVAHALTFVGVHEVPWGSNLGRPHPEDWQGFFGMRAVPWCGCFVAAMWRDVLGDHADQGIGSPGTQYMYDHARAIGAVINKPVPGCAFVYPGVHTGLVTHVLSGSVVATVEGNHGDQVATDSRAYGPGTGIYFVAPKAIRDNVAPQAPPARLYYIEDPSAAPILRGPWSTAKARDRVLSRLPLARRKAARPVSTPKGFAFLEGPRKVFGPWTTAAARDNALASLRKHQPGRSYRPMSKAADNHARANALGKTT